MKSILSLGLLILLTAMFWVGNVRAQPLQCTLGNSEKWGSGWCTLQSTIDFGSGAKLRIVLGGTARKILVRFLPRGVDPKESTGIDGSPRLVPTNRVLEVTLESDHNRIWQISVHGGPNPWDIPLGQDNGPASIISIERVASKSKK